MDTPMLQRLREVLRQTTREEFQRDWAAIKAKGFHSPTARDFIRSFRYTPVYRDQEFFFLNAQGSTEEQLAYELDARTSSLSLAA